MMRTPFFVLASAAASRMFLVLSVSGVCSVMKSARLSRSSSSTFSTPMSLARSGDRNGSKAITFMRRPSARSATIEPILPQPITPSVLPVISTPMKRFFSHLPAWVEASACGISRASASISAMACSAVVIELPNGVFITMMPLAVAAGMSTLSTPMPARPITFSFVAFSMILAVDLGGGADREAVIIADDLGELVLVLAEIGLEVDLDAAILEDLHGGGGQRVGNENFGFGHWMFLDLPEEGRRRCAGVKSRGVFSLSPFLRERVGMRAATGRAGERLTRR